MGKGRVMPEAVRCWKANGGLKNCELAYCPAAPPTNGDDRPLLPPIEPSGSEWKWLNDMVDTK